MACGCIGAAVGDRGRGFNGGGQRGTQGGCYWLPGVLRARWLPAGDRPALGQQSDPAGEHDPLLAHHPDPGEAVPAGRGAGGWAGELVAWDVRAGPEELRAALSPRVALTHVCVASRCWVPSPLSGPSSRSSCAGGRSSPAPLGLMPGARRSARTGDDCCSSLAGELSPGCAVPGQGGALVPAWPLAVPRGPGPPWGPPGLS